MLGGEVRECDGGGLLGELEAGIVVFVAETCDAKYNTKDKPKLLRSRFRHWLASQHPTWCVLWALLRLAMFTVLPRDSQPVDLMT